MIDALLGEEGEEGKEEMLHCSLDSIDRLGDSLSLPPPSFLPSPSLQFEKESWKAGPLLKVATIYLSLDNRAEPGLFTTNLPANLSQLNP